VVRAASDRLDERCRSGLSRHVRHSQGIALAVDRIAPRRLRRLAPPVENSMPEQSGSAADRGMMGWILRRPLVGSVVSYLSSCMDRRSMRIQAAWIGLEAPTAEECEISFTDRGVEVRSTVSGDAVDGVYRLRASSRWEFESLSMTINGRRLQVRRAGNLWLVDGAVRPDLDEAREVDLSVSPLTNSLPIGRLGLQVGQGADIVTAYIRVPELDVMADPQRYTRTGVFEYLYESRRSGFRRTITVDRDGLVTEYPGLFTRGN
jgi:uncharacterized protein